MKTTLKQVQEFHEVFVTKQGLSEQTIKACRPTLLQEELDELNEAIAKNDEGAILDALTDLQYVLDGTYIAFGLDSLKDDYFAEVHHKNMAKLGPDGKPIIRADGKILKPPGWTPPDPYLFLHPNR